MKPGWKTTEFWTTTIAQALALAAVLGIVNSQDAALLGEAIAKMVLAVAAFLTNGLIVVKYIQSRFSLKALENNEMKSRIPTILPMTLTALFLIAPGAAHAQSILPWRHQIDQRLRDQQSQISALIANQRPAPAPIQPLPIPGEPKQQLPVPGEPRQQLDPKGEPRQQLDPKGDPKQQLDPKGNPRQQLPTQPPPNVSPISYSIRYRALARPLDDK